MKTREIRERLQSMGFEKGTMYCLEAINESILGLTKSVMSLADDQNKIIDTIGNVVGVAGAMKDHLTKIEEGDDDDLGPSTQSIKQKDE